MLKEMPKAGDKVRYLGGLTDRVLDSSDGEVYVIDYIDGSGDAWFNLDDNTSWYIEEGEFANYELVYETTPSLIDILTNLAQAVVRLQKEVDSLSEQTDSNAKDIVTFAEEFTEFKEQRTVKDVDISDLSYNVSRFVSDYLKEGLRYERNS